MNLSKFANLSPLYSSFFERKEKFGEESSSSVSINIDDIFSSLNSDLLKISMVQIVIVLFAWYLIYRKQAGFNSAGTLMLAILLSLCCTPCVIVYMLFFFKMNK